MLQKELSIELNTSKGFPFNITISHLEGVSDISKLLSDKFKEETGHMPDIDFQELVLLAIRSYESKEPKANLSENMGHFILHLKDGGICAIGDKCKYFIEIKYE